jgi:hypothetical protein
MCISVCEYGLCENEDPTYNNPNHCKYDTRASPNQVNTVISELEKGIKLWSENLQPKDDYENGVIAGLKEAISLLKAGKI